MEEKHIIPRRDANEEIRIGMEINSYACTLFADIGKFATIHPHIKNYTKYEYNTFVFTVQEIRELVAGLGTEHTHIAVIMGAHFEGQRHPATDELFDYGSPTVMIAGAMQVVKKETQEAQKTKPSYVIPVSTTVYEYPTQTHKTTLDNLNGEIIIE
jgi:coenzyme PQQ precursor peptide PqqA